MNAKKIFIAIIFFILILIVPQDLWSKNADLEDLKISITRRCDVGKETGENDWVTFREGFLGLEIWIMHVFRKDYRRTLAEEFIREKKYSRNEIEQMVDKKLAQIKIASSVSDLTKTINLVMKDSEGKNVLKNGYAFIRAHEGDGLIINKTNFYYFILNTEIPAGTYDFQVIFDSTWNAQEDIYHKKTESEIMKIHVKEATNDAERMRAKYCQLNFHMCCSGDYETAVTLGEELIQSDKDSIEAYVLLGDAYVRIGQKEKALKSYSNTLIKYKPGDEFYAYPISPIIKLREELYKETPEEAFKYIQSQMGHVGQ